MEINNNELQEIGYKTVDLAVTENKNNQWADKGISKEAKEKLFTHRDKKKRRAGSHNGAPKSIKPGLCFSSSEKGRNGDKECENVADLSLPGKFCH